MTRFLLIIALVALGACSAMRTPYLRPSIDIPPTYPHADESAVAFLDRWWKSFGDPQLEALVNQALDSNSDLAIAALNVRAAQLQAHIAVINPTVSAGYVYQNSRQLSGNVPAVRMHSLSASASYELDLWGQLSAYKDAATWEAHATKEDRRSVALALIGTAINLYYQLANLNQRIAYGEQSIAYAGRILQLVNTLKSAGGATQLEVAESEQNLHSLEASQAGLIEQRVELHNAITVLLNGSRSPTSFERAALPEGPPPPVAAGLPATLLQRRPDLRAAELRLRESLARMDAARLSFYPAVSLTGSIGTASTELAQITRSPIGALTAAVALPFVQFNEAKFATEISRTQYEQAVMVFRKTLLQALFDVDNALFARTQLTEESSQLERSLESARTAEHLYEVRYRAGAVALRFWLDAQEARRQAETALADNRLSRLQNYVTICQALGGGVDFPQNE